MIINGVYSFLNIFLISDPKYFTVKFLHTKAVPERKMVALTRAELKCLYFFMMLNDHRVFDEKGSPSLKEHQCRRN